MLRLPTNWGEPISLKCKSEILTVSRSGYFFTSLGTSVLKHTMLAKVFNFCQHHSGKSPRSELFTAFSGSLSKFIKLRLIELNRTKTGIVVKSTGSWYLVRTPTDEIVSCRMIGKFRLNKFMLTNPVGVGDVVEFVTEEKDTTATIRKIMPRRNYVVRQSPRQKHYLHLLAANIDQALLFMTIVAPNVKQGFIDRFLLMLEPQDIPTIIIFNKCDLWDEAATELFQHLKNLYEGIGYTVLAVSATEGTGMETLRELLKNKTTLIAGQSGVGKSTSVNALQPHMHLRIGDISDYSGKGQHTTTFAEMHPLSFGGYLIDTPGIKNLSFNNLEPTDVAHNFREFFELSDNCRFRRSCMHIEEPNCAIKNGLEDGTISELRYTNYLKILEEIEDVNFWERHKELDEE
jgi:ribosome biogenesis GTPase / thiamine phosphate phosphatase